MRGICLSICVIVLLACTKAPDVDGPETEASVPGAPRLPSTTPAPPNDSAAMPAAPAQTGADQYLRLAMDAAQRRYEAATAACVRQPIPDDCISSATAAMEQEQAAARIEHQRQLQELHQGG